MSEMARPVLEYDESGIKLLFADVIIQAVQDYERLKKKGEIVDGKPAKALSYTTAGGTGSVEALCDFFWQGWMEKIVLHTGLNISSARIYKKLEPELWQSLISQHLKG